MIELFKEIFERTRSAILILVAGDFTNGNIRKLHKALNEIDYIIEHAPDLSKDEIVELIASSDVSKASTGLRQNVSHVLMSVAGWRLLVAQARETEWHHLKQKARRLVKKELAIQTVLDTAQLEDIKIAYDGLPEQRKREIREILDD